MNKITLVTSPDDVPIDAFRILCVELTHDQSQMVSDAITRLEDVVDTVIYVWKMGDSVEWLLDKKPKSDIILFNADIEFNGAIELITGYMAAQPNSYYFGLLKSLGNANKRDIYDIVSLQETLNINIKKYEQKFK
jgi:hypothetical protein